MKVDISKYNSNQIADMIIIGIVSEKEFLAANLSENDILEVFKGIRNKRGWKVDDKKLASTLKQKNNLKTPVILLGSCSQSVEQASGDRDAVYPYRQTTPIGNECGGDPDDIVLEYYTWWGPSTNPDNVRWYSLLWWVRWTVGTCYPGGLSANGLCTTNTRVCIGSCAKWLGGDLNYLYLWRV